MRSVRSARYFFQFLVIFNSYYTQIYGYVDKGRVDESANTCR